MLDSLPELVVPEAKGGSKRLDNALAESRARRRAAATRYASTPEPGATAAGSLGASPGPLHSLVIASAATPTPYGAGNYRARSVSGFSVDVAPSSATSPRAVAAMSSSLNPSPYPPRRDATLVGTALLAAPSSTETAKAPAMAGRRANQDDHNGKKAAANLSSHGGTTLEASASAVSDTSSSLSVTQSLARLHAQQRQQQERYEVSYPRVLDVEYERVALGTSAQGTTRRAQLVRPSVTDLATRSAGNVDLTSNGDVASPLRVNSGGLGGGGSASTAAGESSGSNAAKVVGGGGVSTAHHATGTAAGSNNMTYGALTATTNNFGTLLQQQQQQPAVPLKSALAKGTRGQRSGLGSAHYGARDPAGDGALPDNNPHRGRGGRVAVLAPASMSVVQLVPLAPSEHHHHHQAQTQFLGGGPVGATGLPPPPTGNRLLPGPSSQLNATSSVMGHNQVLTSGRPQQQQQHTATPAQLAHTVNPNRLAAAARAVVSTSSAVAGWVAASASHAGAPPPEFSPLTHAEPDGADSPRSGMLAVGGAFSASSNMGGVGLDETVQPRALKPLSRQAIAAAVAASNNSGHLPVTTQQQHGVRGQSPPTTTGKRGGFFSRLAPTPMAVADVTVDDAPYGSHRDGGHDDQRGSLSMGPFLTAENARPINSRPSSNRFSDVSASPQGPAGIAGISATAGPSVLPTPPGVASIAPRASGAQELTVAGGVLALESDAAAGSVAPERLMSHMSLGLLAAGHSTNSNMASALAAAAAIAASPQQVERKVQLRMPISATAIAKERQLYEEHVHNQTTVVGRGRLDDHALSQLDPREELRGYGGRVAAQLRAMHQRRAEPSLREVAGALATHAAEDAAAFEALRSVEHAQLQASVALAQTLRPDVSFLKGRRPPKEIPAPPPHLRFLEHEAPPSLRPGMRAMQKRGLLPPSVFTANKLTHGTTNDNGGGGGHPLLLRGDDGGDNNSDREDGAAVAVGVDARSGSRSPRMLTSGNGNGGSDCGESAEGKDATRRHTPQQKQHDVGVSGGRRTTPTSLAAGGWPQADWRRPGPTSGVARHLPVDMQTNPLAIADASVTLDVTSATARQLLNSFRVGSSSTEKSNAIRDAVRLSVACDALRRENAEDALRTTMDDRGLEADFLVQRAKQLANLVSADPGHWRNALPVAVGGAGGAVPPLHLNNASDAISGVVRGLGDAGTTAEDAGTMQAARIHAALFGDPAENDARSLAHDGHSRGDSAASPAVGARVTYVSRERRVASAFAAATRNLNGGNSVVPARTLLTLAGNTAAVAADPHRARAVIPLEHLLALRGLESEEDRRRDAVLFEEARAFRNGFLFAFREFHLEYVQPYVRAHRAEMEIDMTIFGLEQRLEGHSHAVRLLHRSLRRAYLHARARRDGPNPRGGARPVLGAAIQQRQHSVAIPMMLSEGATGLRSPFRAPLSSVGADRSHDGAATSPLRPVVARRGATGTQGPLTPLEFTPMDGPPQQLPSSAFHRSTNTMASWRVGSESHPTPNGGGSTSVGMFTPSSAAAASNASTGPSNGSGGANHGTHVHQPVGNTRFQRPLHPQDAELIASLHHQNEKARQAQLLELQRQRETMEAAQAAAEARAARRAERRRLREAAQEDARAAGGLTYSQQADSDSSEDGGDPLDCNLTINSATLTGVHVGTDNNKDDDQNQRGPQTRRRAHSGGGSSVGTAVLPSHTGGDAPVVAAADVPLPEFARPSDAARTAGRALDRLKAQTVDLERRMLVEVDTFLEREQETVLNAQRREVQNSSAAKKRRNTVAPQVLEVAPHQSRGGLHSSQGNRAPAPVMQHSDRSPTGGDDTGKSSLRDAILADPTTSLTFIPAKLLSGNKYLEQRLLDQIDERRSREEALAARAIAAASATATAKRNEIDSMRATAASRGSTGTAGALRSTSTATLLAAASGGGGAGTSVNFRSGSSVAAPQQMTLEKPQHQFARALSGAFGPVVMNADSTSTTEEDDDVDKATRSSNESSSDDDRDVANDSSSSLTEDSYDDDDISGPEVTSSQHPHRRHDRSRVAPRRVSLDRWSSAPATNGLSGGNSAVRPPRPPPPVRTKSHHDDLQRRSASDGNHRQQQEVSAAAERARARKRRRDRGRRLFKLMARRRRSISSNTTPSGASASSSTAGNGEDAKLVQALLMPTSGEGWITALLNALAESCAGLPVMSAAQLDARHAQALRRIDAIVTAVDDRVEAVAGLRAFSLLLAAEERRLRRRPPVGAATSAALAIANLPKLPRNPVSRAAYERCLANGGAQASDASGSDGNDADGDSASDASSDTSTGSRTGHSAPGRRRRNKKYGGSGAAEPEIQLGADWFFLDSGDNVRSLPILHQLWLLQARLQRMRAIQAALMQARNAQCRAQGVSTQMSIAAIACIVRQQQANDKL